MVETEPTLNPRDHALQLLATFGNRVLPNIVRRIAGWKRIPASEIGDLVLELRQELAIDCLEHPDVVTALPATARHARWMRLAERWVYRHRVMVARRTHDREPDDEPAPNPPSPRVHRLASRLEQLMPDGHVVRLANGRCNFTASAERTGQRPQRVREAFEDLADEISGDESHLGFWRARLGEALTGLAADLLRDRAAVQMLPRPRTSPDPVGRLRRLRRLGARFHVRPATLDVRRILTQWVRRPNLDDRAPRRLLEQAAELCPEHASAWLWLFEAAVIEGDLRAAGHALRRARGCRDHPRHSTILARARLLEARGRGAAAISSVERAMRRRPRDAQLRFVLASAIAAPIADSPR